MGQKDKWFEDKDQAFEKLYKDVEKNNVKTYSIYDYQSKVSLSIHPESFLSKCSHVEVAVSGEAPTGNDWMVITPFRVDQDLGEKVYDLDPVLTCFDSNKGTVSESGVVAYHQKFQYRTTKIEDSEKGTMDETVGELRDKLIDNSVQLENGSVQTLNALSYMHDKYKDDFKKE